MGSRTRVAAAVGAVTALGPLGVLAEPAYADVVVLDCQSIPANADPSVLETVYRTGRGLGADSRVMLAAFEAGWVESRMNNLPCGDRDSLGVFQQRPSQGWGTPEQIMNVSYAATQFFNRAIPIAANNPGLAAWEIAQAVQRSCCPSRYAEAAGTANNLIAQAKDLTTGKVTVGYYRSATASWGLRNAQAGGPADAAFQYGPAGARPISGDWNNDGKTTIGYYSPGSATFGLRNANGAGPAEISFSYGPAGMIPLAGDWNNDGKTTIGYYNPGNGTFHLRNANGPGPDDAAFQFGPAGMIPLVGDWNNDGKTTVGYYNPGNGTWNLRDTNGAGPADASFVWNGGGQTPITGDWNADGKTTIGFYNPGNAVYTLRNALSAGPADHQFSFGPAGSTPITGDWNND